MDHRLYGRRTVLHELGHHWWGDNAHQKSWEEFWLNESLASFYQAEIYRVNAGINTGPWAATDAYRDDREGLGAHPQHRCAHLARVSHQGLGAGRAG